jgi:hypothetical protein
LDSFHFRRWYVIYGYQRVTVHVCTPPLQEDVLLTNQAFFAFVQEWILQYSHHNSWDN